MANIIVRKFSAPDETRRFEHGQLQLIDSSEGAVGLATFEKGWKWSKDVKPLAGTASCEAAHAVYFLSGRMTIRMDDGEEVTLWPGDFAMIPPGHDAWVVGEDSCVALDWRGMADYARQSTGRTAAKAEQPPMHH